MSLMVNLLQLSVSHQMSIVHTLCLITGHVLSSILNLLPTNVHLEQLLWMLYTVYGGTENTYLGQKCTSTLTMWLTQAIYEMNQHTTEHTDGWQVTVVMLNGMPVGGVSVFPQ